MRITEKHLKEFFPRNMRFLHYVAKRYGYSFYNDLASEKATFNAQKAILKMYNEGKEFESNEHLYGIVMSSFRYAILQSYTKTPNERELNIRPESDYISRYHDSDYSPIENKTISYEKPYDDTADVMYGLLKKTLNPIEFSVFYLKYKKDYQLKQIATELDLPLAKVKTIRTRIVTKYKRINKLIKNKEYEYSQEFKTSVETVLKNERRVQREIQYKSTMLVKEQRERYIETVSWLGLD